LTPQRARCAASSTVSQGLAFVLRESGADPLPVVERLRLSMFGSDASSAFDRRPRDAKQDGQFILKQYVV
jgi:hypothetical protein